MLAFEENMICNLATMIKIANQKYFVPTVLLIDKWSLFYKSNIIFKTDFSSANSIIELIELCGTH